MNISVPAEVEQALDARTSMNVIGDLAAYQAYQLGQAMPVAAANPAGGLAGAGVGVGMGMAIAAPMLGGAAKGSPQTPPPLPAVVWWVAASGQTQGPFTPEQLARSGLLRADTLVWTAGMQDWQPAASDRCAGRAAAASAAALTTELPGRSRQPRVRTPAAAPSSAISPCSRPRSGA